MKILHLSNSYLAGAPANLSTILNKYTNGKIESKSICLHKFKKIGLENLSWDHYDYIGDNIDIIKDMMNDADILLHHQRPFFIRDTTKKECIMFHAEPTGYVPNVTYKEFTGKKIVVANYQANHYTDAIIVPNMIDIWDDKYLPARKQEYPIKIFYSYANEVVGTPADKGSKQTLEILTRIKSLYPVLVDFATNTPHNECMKRKSNAHIVIDECKTGASHLQSSEGLSVGAATINNISTMVEKHIFDVTGATSTPYVKTNIDDLYNTIAGLFLDQSKLFEIGKQSRIWMEKYFDPKNLVKKYVSFFDSL